MVLKLYFPFLRRHRNCKSECKYNIFRKNLIIQFIWIYTYLNQNYQNVCNGHGTKSGSKCVCEKSHTGDNCQYSQDCNEDVEKVAIDIILKKFTYLNSIKTSKISQSNNISNWYTYIWHIKRLYFGSWMKVFM